MTKKSRDHRKFGRLLNRAKKTPDYQASINEAIYGRNIVALDDSFHNDYPIIINGESVSGKY